MTFWPNILAWLHASGGEAERRFVIKRLNKKLLTFSLRDHFTVNIADATSHGTGFVFKCVAVV